MEELIVRPAEPRDDVAVGELLVQSFLTAYAAKMPEVKLTEQRFRELRDMATKRASATVLVAEQAGQVAGTVMLYRPGHPHAESWFPNTANLRQLAVAPSHFGKRIAGPLMDEAERIAFGWGVGAICLHVRRGAHGVARMYAGRGYARDPAGDLEHPSVSLEAYVKRPPA
jgi:predicted N-acetyltransferase YhbS